MKKTGLKASFALKLISVVMLVIVFSAIAISFITRSKRQPRVPEISAALMEQKIDKKERVEFREMNKDKIDSEVKADRHYIGTDGLYHLEGNVKISLFGRGEGEDIILKGEEIIHERDWSYFWLRGEATVEFRDLIVESSVLEYDAEKKVFRSEKRVRFMSDTISGTAQTCDYFLEPRKAELRGEVYLKLQPREEASVPLEIDTEYFEYYAGKRRGMAEGGVELKHGESHAAAGSLEFELSASRKQIKLLFLKKKVKVFLQGEFQNIKPFPDQTTLVLHGDTCWLEAEEIRVDGFVDLPQVKKLDAYGNCSFRFESKTGSYTRIEGNEISFHMTDKGDLKSMVVREKAKITEENGEKNSHRIIEGQRMQFQGGKNILEIEGTDISKARMLSEQSEVTSLKIQIFLENNNIKTDEDTKVILYPEENGREAGGFFSADHPVFVTSRNMRYSEEHKRFRFSGGTRLWQTKETIKAQEMTLGVEARAFRAIGGVESVLPYRSEEKEREESILIESSTMEYNAGKNLITYRDKIRLESRDIVLTAKLLTVAVDKGTGDMKNIVAREDVVVAQGEYTGHGKEAKFDVGKETIIVSGNPVLIDENKGRTEGGKLTFYIPDGRIVVENEDRERSVTVIKSES